MDMLMPINWDCILPATAKPAASSDALLTRRPDERRSIAFSILLVAVKALARAFKCTHICVNRSHFAAFPKSLLNLKTT